MGIRIGFYIEREITKDTDKHNYSRRSRIYLIDIRLVLRVIIRLSLMVGVMNGFIYLVVFLIKKIRGY